MNKKSVLIVEDDAQIASILAKIIEKFNEFEVIGIAATANEAIAILDGFAPELVFLDVTLAQGSGLDVIKHARFEMDGSNINVVMVTAAKEVDILKKSMTFGAFDYILKPISFERLNESLNRYLEYSKTLNNSGDLNQQDVDVFWGKGTQATDSKEETVRVPKGIDVLTLDKIYKIFVDKPTTPYTAEAMAECIGTSRTTARRYLEYLLTTQQVMVNLEYGTVGRPERRYILQK